MECLTHRKFLSHEWMNENLEFFCTTKKYALSCISLSQAILVRGNLILWKEDDGTLLWKIYMAFRMLSPSAPSAHLSSFPLRSFFTASNHGDFLSSGYRVPPELTASENAVWLTLEIKLGKGCLQSLSLHILQRAEPGFFNWHPWWSVIPFQYTPFCQL